MSRKATILVVEDDPMVRDVVTLMLEHDYSMIGAGGVRDALSALVLSQIDLVVLDCMLPDGSYQGVLDCADRSGVPVVLMTGRFEHMLSIERGNHAWLLKPFGPDQLLEIVRATLGSRPDDGIAARFATAEPIQWRSANSAMTPKPERPTLRPTTLPEAIVGTQQISPKTTALILRARDCVRQSEVLRECQAAILSKLHPQRLPFSDLR